MFEKKKFKAFTLTEVFVAMIVIAIIGTICISFLKNRNDHSREYMYYSTYQNLVKLVDTIILEENNNFTQTGSCNGHSCVLLRMNNLCTAARVLLNHRFGNNTHCAGRIANGIQFIAAPTYSTENNNTHINFNDTNASNPLECSNATTNVAKATARYSPTTGIQGCLFWVDIDGQDKGPNRPFYDVMPFYISSTGMVIPEWGQVTGVRGYNGLEFDAGGNPSLMTFDVVYTDADSNKLLILTPDDTHPNDQGRGVSFARAACLAGYVSGTYCNVGDGGAAITRSARCTDFADCRVRLVKKLKIKGKM